MDESFRELLPYLRPQSGDVSWLAWVALGVLLTAVAAGAAASLVVRRHHRRDLYRSFERIAQERGLSRSQRLLLAGIARRERMANPLLLLSSLSAFDRHVGGHAQRLVCQGGRARERAIGDISEARRRLGFGHVQEGRPLVTTRELQPGLLLMLWAASGGDRGFTQCVIVARDDRAIVAIPLLREADEWLRQLQPRERVKVRFWGPGGVEYRFRTEILDTVQETTTLLLCHAQELERVQPYDYYRLRVDLEMALLAVADVVYRTLTLDDALVQEQARPVPGRAFYISGDGIGVRVSQPFEGGQLFIVDPSWSGGFPLAGLACRVQAVSQEPEAWRLDLLFVDLGEEEQQAVIVSVQRHQVTRAHAS